MFNDKKFYTHSSYSLCDLYITAFLILFGLFVLILLREFNASNEGQLCYSAVLFDFNEACYPHTEFRSKRTILSLVRICF